MRLRDKPTEWQTSEQTYLARLGFGEWMAQGMPTGRRGKRYSPSVFHAALVEALGNNDEERFKSLKLDADLIKQF